MTPQTVNAYYDPSMNSLNVPAGILQPPYFDVSWSDAVNYGATGATIGHEMTHGFDDEGAKFDGHGNLKNWWAPAGPAEVSRGDALHRRAVLALHGGRRIARAGRPGDRRGGRGSRRLDAGVARTACARQLARSTRRRREDSRADQQFFIAFAHSWAGGDPPGAGTRNW